MRAENIHGNQEALSILDGAHNNQWKEMENVRPLLTAAWKLLIVNKRLNFYARILRKAITNNIHVQSCINLMCFSTDDEKAIKIDPKSFDMKPVLVAPKIEISGGVYLIPSEKVTYHDPTSQFSK